MEFKSESTKEIAKALAEAQKHMKSPKKSGAGNYGDYATINDSRAAVLPHLNTQNIAVIQSLGYDDKSEFLETVLLHNSGEWLSSKMRLKMDKPTMQGYGSAITYAARYSLEALACCGGGSLDDDGEQLEDKKNEKAKPALKLHAEPAAKPAQSQTSEFRFKFGKYKDKTFDDVAAQFGVADLGNYIQYLQRPNGTKTAEENKKSLEMNQPLFRAYETWKAASLAINPSFIHDIPAPSDDDMPDYFIK